MSDTTTPPAAGGRIRGPSYPVFPLAEAIRRTGLIFEAERTTPVSANAALKNHLKLSPASSSGMRALAALLAYGLLQDEGKGEDKRVRVTELARTILRHPDKTSAEYKAALKTAALTPPIHKSVFDAFKDGLPSDSNLRWELEKTWGYNVTSLEDVAEEIKATFAFADVYGGATLPAPSTSTGKTAEEPDAGGGTPPVVEPKGAEGKAKEANPMPPVVAAAGTATLALESLDIPIPLISGGRATLRLPIPMSEGDYGLLRTMLLANLDGLKAAIVKAPAPVAPPVTEGGAS